MRLAYLLCSPAVVLILQLLFSLWFLSDFFLARDSSTASNLWRSHPSHHHQDLKDIYSLAEQVKTKHCPDRILERATFDKLILIVIDALGSEFVPSITAKDGSISDETDRDKMPFIERLVRQDQAFGLVARAATPTVTMPRIKALVSGTIPSFADILFNLARDVSKFDDDNILRIAKNHDRSIVFYGDDTWLSLFDRSMFTRVKETYSFFASDYTTIDTNVTEKALPETRLDQIDWDFLILHYLGLDHIGHVFGSNKVPQIGAKLIEMDRVVRQIHENMSLKKELRTLVVVCGDHGMTPDGNHGGNSAAEINTAMIFLPINSKSNYSFTPQHSSSPSYQIDLAATLSLLFGQSLPDMNRGVAIAPLLESLWRDEDPSKLVCAALENILQLVDLMDPIKFTNSSEGFKLKDLLTMHLNPTTSSEWMNQVSHEYFELARKIQSTMLETVTSNTSPYLLLIGSILMIFLTIIQSRKTAIRLLIPVISRKERILCLATLSIPIFMQGSTDFIETERIFWPLFTLISTASFSVLALTGGSKRAHEFDMLKVFLFMFTFLVTTCWNNLKLGRDDSIMSDTILPHIALAFLLNSLRQNSALRELKKPALALIGVTLYLSKLFEESPAYDDISSIQYRALAQRVAIIVILVYAAINSVGREPELGSSSKSPMPPTVARIASSWMALSFLLARRHSFVFLIANLIMEAGLNSIVNSMGLSKFARLALYTSFAQTAFYNQGNTNLFSSIDIKPAFFGQTGYNFYLAVPLVAIATYSTQIYWYMKLFQRVIAGEPAVNNNRERINAPSQSVPFIDEYNLTKGSSTSFTATDVCNLVTQRNALSLGYYMCVCIVLRNHLFIWSVISPKLVYHFASNNILLLTALLISSVPTSRDK